MSAQKQVSPESVPWHEAAASGSPADHRILCVISNTHAPVVTTNATAAAPSFWPGPPLVGGDPFAATSAVFGGRVFVGVNDPLGLTFSYYDLGQDAGEWASNPIARISHTGFTDKPWMAIGPSSVPFGEINFYVTCQLTHAGDGCSSNDRVLVYRSPISSIFSSPWADNTAVPLNPEASPCELTPECNYRGWAAIPVVTDDGDIVAVVCDPNTNSGGPGCYNQRRPYVIWSNDDGHTWLPEASVPIMLGNNLVEAIGTQIDPQFIADTPFYVNRRTHAPTIALDRATNSVYVAFAARRDTNHSAEADWNSDIWIFRGTRNEDGEWVFGNNPTSQVLHLTDEMLGRTPNADGKGPDQFVPAIAIDCAGAINLMFYDNRAEAQAPLIPDASNIDGRPVDVYYARIRNWPGGTPEVYTKRLTPASIAVVSGDGFLGDYQTIAEGGAQGQWLYPVYISKKNDVRTCYTHSVFIRECLSDLNMNRAADAGDVDLFWEAFDEAAPAADVTDDGFVNVDDVDEFVDVYSDVLGG